MDKYKVKINPRAIRELDNIYEYIANEKLAPENDKEQVDRIKKAILKLAFHLLYDKLYIFFNRFCPIYPYNRTIQ